MMHGPINIRFFFYIHGSVRRDSRLKKSNEMQHSRLKKLAPQTVRSVPEAVTTVLCTPDDGRDGRPKHVE